MLKGNTADQSLLRHDDRIGSVGWSGQNWDCSCQTGDSRRAWMGGGGSCQMLLEAMHVLRRIGMLLVEGDVDGIGGEDGNTRMVTEIADGYE